MFLIKIENNSILFSSAEAEGRFQKLLSSFNNTGKTLSLHIEVHSKSTTEAQMELFTAMVVAGKDYTGMSYSEFEAELISKFAPKKLEEQMFGDKQLVKIHPKDMTMEQFKVFIQECSIFIKEFFDIDFKIE